MLARLPHLLLRLEGLAIVVATKVALIWLAHTGADRLFGYGLKYPTAFKDTHLSRV